MQFRKLIGWKAHKHIRLYEGYGNQNSVWIFGHLLSGKIPPAPISKSNLWHNTKELIKRFLINPLPQSAVLIRVGETWHKAISDETGYFELKVTHEFKNGWQDIQAKLPDSQETVNSSVYIFSENENIVISDIDDTFIISHSTRKLKKLWLLLSRNHESRKLVDGIIPFFDKIKSTSCKDQPFFFVSSSEWNLYEFLKSLIEFHGLPRGIFRLKRMKFSIGGAIKSNSGDHSHKFTKINNLINQLPQVKFILVGDNAQKDPKIYTEIAKKHTGRIQEIYINNVRTSRKEHVVEMKKELETLGIKVSWMHRV